MKFIKMPDSSLHKTILVTRSEEESKNDFAELENLEYKLIYFPTIKAVPVLSNEVDNTLSKLNEFDYIIFTSKNSVKFFLSRLKDLKINKNFTNTKIVATGNVTAKLLEESNITVDFVPEKFSADGLLEKFRTTSLKGKKIFIPCSAIARDELSVGLKNLEASVFNLPIYDITKADLTKDEKIINIILNDGVDLYAFTSPSSFNNFVELLNLKNIKCYFIDKTIAAIGDTTSNAILEKGIDVHIVPKNFTVKSLANSILEYLSK